MKIPLSWLKEFVPFRMDEKNLSQRLTLGGFEVEDILSVNGEKVLEVNVTPNRGDCLSIQGMAREVSALLGIPLKKRPGTSLKQTRTAREKYSVPVTVKSPHRCPRYCLAVVTGVQVGPSPRWLVEKLEWVGIRSVNNIVDMTNFVLIELGQPLHAFDLNKIHGGRITVRAAQKDEKILTIDGEERELTIEDLVIADERGPVAIAGVMGGKDSEIVPETTSIAVESAWFEPATVRKTSKRLGLQTESSYRFERGVDPEGVFPALSYAVKLMEEVAGGKFVPPAVHLAPGTPGKFKKRPIFFVPHSLEDRLGGQWSPSEIREAFRRLSLSVQNRRSERWKVNLPSYRWDLDRPEDLMEEVSRLYGLERIPVSFPALRAIPPPPDLRLEEDRRIRRLLANLGFQETIHSSFLSGKEISDFDPSLLENCITVENPLGLEDSIMRPSLLPSLLKTAAHHHRHKIFAFRAFELRKKFWKVKSDLGDSACEAKSLALLITGPRLMTDWEGDPREADFYDIKGLLERVFLELRVNEVSFIGGTAPFLHPSRQAALEIRGERAGVVGEIHPEVQERFDLKKTAYLFEVDWDRFISARAAENHFREFSRYPVVERDIALVVDESVLAGSVGERIQRQDPLIQETSLFDLYRGAQVPQGKKSLAFAIRLGCLDRTLTEPEVDAIMEKIVRCVKNEFSAEVR